MPSWQQKPNRPQSSPFFSSHLSTERSLQHLSVPTEPIPAEYQQFVSLMIDETDIDFIFENIKNGSLGEQAAYALKEICRPIYTNICRKQKINLLLVRNKIRQAYADNDINTIIEWVDSFKEELFENYNNLKQ